MSEAVPIKCPVCGGKSDVFWRRDGLPVRCNVLCRTREEAVSTPRGDIHLAVCDDCGYIHNAAFDPARMAYDQAYENSLHFSPRFQAYAEELARRLIVRYDLHGKDVLEIACGQGDFLGLLCDLGDNCGVGFDPSYFGKPADDGSRVRVIADYFSPKYAGERADLICCRHALEHMPDPIGFLRTVHESIGEGRTPGVFFEVPNVLFTLRDLGIWDIIYEHCCYFSAASLCRAFVEACFVVEDVGEVYGGQFLTIDAKPSDTIGRSRSLADDAACVVAETRRFAERFNEKFGTWQRRFDELVDGGRRAVVWGSGSKGVTFLNMMDRAQAVTHVVDINPRKQGMYVAGSGQQIVAPDALRNYKPDAVIVMNPLYVDEIEATVREMGITPVFHVA